MILDGLRRISAPFTLLLVVLGAPGCFRVNTPGAGRSVLPSDAVPRQEYKSRLGNPAFYDEFGIRYRVLDTSQGYVERGLASWYGRDFHGRRTSSGAPYDMYAMTAAHKTLPLPTYVEVTDLDTGNKVVVRINDRGPFVEGRIIDLSYVAALKLGIAVAGTARVEVRALDPPAVDPAGMEAFAPGWSAVDPGYQAWRGSPGAGGVVMLLRHQAWRGSPGAGGAVMLLRAGRGRAAPYRSQVVKGRPTRLEFR